MISFKEFFLLREQVDQNVFYHICDDEHLESILRGGLLVQQGPRSQQLEEEPSVFLFRTEDEASDAVMNWMGDEFDEDSILDLLQITLPSNFPLVNNPEAGEVISQRDIPPRFVKLLRKNI